jgi:hypothetical protein
MKSGNLNFPGPLQACNGTALHLLEIWEGQDIDMKASLRIFDQKYSITAP